MLYQRHRPQTLDDILGNKGTVASLRQMLDRPIAERPRAFLFEGPSGCGKTTLARIVASELNGEFMEVDSADFRGIDYIRDLRRRMNARALSGKDVRVWLLDEAHQLSKDAQSALLKTLEDTPAHVVLMLATTDPKGLLPTILNRCTRFPVELLGERDLYRLMKTVCKNESKTSPSRDVLEKLAESCGGSPRAALTALDKVIDLPAGEQLAVAERFEKAEHDAAELCKLLMEPQTKFKELLPVLKSLKETSDAEGIRRLVLAWCASAMLNPKWGNAPQAYIVLDAFRDPTYNLGWPAIPLYCGDVIFSGSDDVPF